MSTEVKVERPAALAVPPATMSAGSPSSALPTPNSTVTAKSSSTPSPSTPGSGTQSTRNRQPPRKSTQTQQQKIQKRQRATQDQLATLEMEFNKTRAPGGTGRDGRGGGMEKA